MFCINVLAGAAGALALVDADLGRYARTSLDIGIAAVLSMVSISDGAKQIIIADLDTLEGGGNVFLLYRRAWVEKNGRWEPSSSPERLTYADLLAIERECPSVALVRPRVTEWDGLSITAGSGMDTTETRSGYHGTTRAWAEGMRGGRHRACERLVISGGQLARDDLPTALDHARAWGVREVILHAGAQDFPALKTDFLIGRVNRIVLPLQSGDEEAPQEAVKKCREAGVEVTTLTVLTVAAVERLAPLSEQIAGLAPSSVVFSYPFPGQDLADLPPPSSLVSALTPVVDRLVKNGLSVRLSGLPGCYLGPLAAHIGRSGNRWYVDAEHQGPNALLFYPGVLRFWKEESCRFCRLDQVCDGFFREYLSQGFPALTPVD